LFKTAILAESNSCREYKVTPDSRTARDRVVSAAGQVEGRAKTRSEANGKSERHAKRGDIAILDPLFTKSPDTGFL
jgi:hypothetical protein